jgi:hypothetical protein
LNSSDVVYAVILIFECCVLGGQLTSVFLIIALALSNLDRYGGAIKLG